MHQDEYEALATFRYEIRQFLDFSRRMLESSGVPPVQYQAMLAIKAQSDEPMSIGQLAEQLHVRIQSAVELIARMQEAGLVRRSPSSRDRRRILLTLTPHAEAILPELAQRHLVVLREKVPAFSAALARFSAETPRP